jgi:hypothetical protein
MTGIDVWRVGMALVWHFWGGDHSEEFCLWTSLVVELYRSDITSS